jgi:sporulation protein YlmC with PRC-barrel domain
MMKIYHSEGDEVGSVEDSECEQEDGKDSEAEKEDRNGEESERLVKLDKG